MCTLLLGLYMQNVQKETKKRKKEFFIFVLRRFDRVIFEAYNTLWNMNMVNNVECKCKQQYGPNMISLG